MWGDTVGITLGPVWDDTVGVTLTEQRAGLPAHQKHILLPPIGNVRPPIGGLPPLVGLKDALWSQSGIRKHSQAFNFKLNA